MADAQLKHPYRNSEFISSSNARSQENNVFGSRFVTAIVSGDEEGDARIECWQVSVVGEALVKHRLVHACTDPALMLTAQPNDDVPHHTNDVDGEEEKQPEYIPEIFYSFANEQGTACKRIASPTFPVEFLLVVLTHGALDANNRSSLFWFADFPPYWQQDKVEQFFSKNTSRLHDDPDWLASFNALAYLLSVGLLGEPDFSILRVCLEGRDLTSFLETTTWATIQQALLLSKNTNHRAENNNNGDNSDVEMGGKGWSCPHCTFWNAQDEEETCEMCSLPRTH